MIGIHGGGGHGATHPQSPTVIPFQEHPYGPPSHVGTTTRYQTPPRTQAGTHAGEERHSGGREHEGPSRGHDEHERDESVLGMHLIIIEVASDS